MATSKELITTSFDVDNVHSTKSVTEKQLRIDLASIKQMLENKNVSKHNWVGANLQLSERFTKRGAGTRKLLRILEDGCLKLF